MPIKGDVTYEDQPFLILMRELKVLRNKEIPLVKVLWEHHKEKEATWELESEMLDKYHYLFDF